MAKGSIKSSVKQQARRNQSQIPLILGGILVLLVVAVGAVLLINREPETTALAREVSVDEAYALREGGAFILDVRTPEEWNEFHIPDATLIPLDQLPNRINDVPRDQDVVVICRSGNRSASGRDILLNAGFESVTSVAGGVTQWMAAGYPTVSGP